MNDDRIIDEVIRLVDEGVSVTLPVTGQSMLPFLVGGRNSVILQKPEHPQKGDVVLARIEERRYVLHRIVSIVDENVTMMGDGNLSGVEHCLLSDIKALATHIVDGSKKYYLYNRKRRFIAVLWYQLRPIRKYLLAIYKRL